MVPTAKMSVNVSSILCYCIDCEKTREEAAAMPRGKVENLVQNRDFTPEQRREWAEKAWTASVEARKRRKTSAEIMRAVLSCELTPEEADEKLKELGISTYGGAIALAQVQRAMRGDTEAARYCRDTAGDKPTEAMQLAITDKPVKALDMNTLSDAELEALADQADEE